MIMKLSDSVRAKMYTPTVGYQLKKQFDRCVNNYLTIDS